METYIDECPKCQAGEVRITYDYSPGYAPTLSDPGEGPMAFDITCRRCGERLDEFDDVVEACMADYRGECQEAKNEGLAMTKGGAE